MQEVIISPKELSLESSLLAVMTSRELFEQYSAYIDYKRLLPDTERLLKDYKKYYTLYEDHQTIDWNLFYTQFSQNWHIKDLQLEDVLYYKEHVFPSIQREDASNHSVLLGLIQKHTLDKINSSGFNLTKLRTILDDYETKECQIVRSADKEIVTILDVDFNVLDKSEGIPWFLPTLQAGLGSLVKGQLVVVPADFGTGKSAFVISQVAHTINYLTEKGKGCIIYFNSEGTEADVFGRVCSNLFRKQLPEGFEQIVNQREKVREQFFKRYGQDRLLVSQITSNTVDWVYSKLVKYTPDLVIIDITDTLAKEEDVISLKKVFDRLRVISGTTCPIIATTQAGDQTYQDKDTGEIKNRRWLGAKALYGSKTGKGGAADTIITIGKDDDNSSLRYIATPKKKRGEAVSITCELIEKYSLYKELEWL